MACLCAVPRAQVTERVSVATNGGQADHHSYQARLSGDGTRAVFMSHATNLVVGDTNGLDDVFVRDRIAGTTVRVDVDSNGVQANNSARFPAISDDGRYVAFESFATNLVPGDTNGREDIFVHDLSTGITTRVSVSSQGAQAVSGASYPSFSGDGRFVGFSADSNNLVPGDANNTWDVFVHDRLFGITELVSVDSQGVQGNGLSISHPALSTDGRYVAFLSIAGNFVSGDTNGTYDCFVRDRVNQTTRCASVSASGPKSCLSDPPAISADGRYVSFTSASPILVAGDTNGVDDAFVHDMVTGQTTRLSLDSFGGEANDYSGPARFADSGRECIFLSDASNLAAGDTNAGPDVFARDRTTGITSRVNLTTTGGQGGAISWKPSVSRNGRFVLFESNSSAYVVGDSNNFNDVFVRDRFGFDPPIPFCDGGGATTTCPCGIAGDTWGGCPNSSFQSGAALTGAGLPSASAADSLVLTATQLSGPGLFFQGDAQVGAGAGMVFGDGLLCVGGMVTRMGIVFPNSGQAWLPNGSLPAPIHGVGATIAGDVRHYQCWYRDALAHCTAETFNLTNGVSVTWLP